MLVNQSMLDSYFAIYNAMLFDGQLNPDLIVCSEYLLDTEVVGYFDPDCDAAGVIGISQELNLEDSKKVLVHEMIHAWDWDRRGTTCHDQVFTNKARECSELLGFHID